MLISVFQQFVVRRHHDHRHFRINQRQWAVLKLARRIGFRVNVGDLSASAPLP